MRISTQAYHINYTGTLHPLNGHLNDPTCIKRKCHYSPPMAYAMWIKTEVLSNK